MKDLICILLSILFLVGGLWWTGIDTEAEPEQPADRTNDDDFTPLQ